MNSITWDEYGMRLANTASLKSKDPSSKVGAAILSEDKAVLSLGFNGFPRGVKDLDSRYIDREIKYALIAHAERNAIDLCPVRPVGATLYVNRPNVCKECAKSIIQSGIKRVVANKTNTFGSGNENIWLDDHILTDMMFKEAGVVYDSISFEENDVQNS